jgi:hypothetical protein
VIGRDDKEETGEEEKDTIAHQKMQPKQEGLLLHNPVENLLLEEPAFRGKLVGTGGNDQLTLEGAVEIAREDEYEEIGEEGAHWDTSVIKELARLI